MATIFDLFGITDEELEKSIVEDNLKVSVKDFRADINEMIAREKQSPAAVGKPAPDFEAETVTEDGKPSGDFYKLSAQRGKVIGLMFGSYTCPIFSGKTARHQEIYEALRDKVEFVCVYTREAHPVDGVWPLDSYDESGQEIAIHNNMLERAAAARACTLGLGLDVPMVLDNLDNDIMELYSGEPERLYVIDGNGIITYRSSMGPFDMEDVENWYEALQKQI